MKKLYFFLVLFGVASLNGGVSPREIKDLKVFSPAFERGQELGSRYTCDGENVSPPIEWGKGPENTKFYVLICEDPDAPGDRPWIHWILYNIPASTDSLPENVEKEQRLSDGAIQDINDFKQYGYGGPCPPGGTHRYFFKVYALDTVLKAGPGLSKKKLLREIEGHILARGELMGTYSR